MKKAKLRSLPLLELMLACCCTLLPTGCSSYRQAPRGSLSNVFECASGSVFLFRGRYETNHMTLPTAVARYYRYLNSPRSSVKVSIDVLFYPGSLSGALPQEALLLLTTDKRSSLGLLGMDADQSILPDTPHNMERVLQRIRTSSLLPERRAWLPESEAISIAKQALHLEAEREPVRLVAKRYEFGWEVRSMPPPAYFGGELKVVVGDNRVIKMCSKGF